jgi:hypothetical protein
VAEHTKTSESVASNSDSRKSRCIRSSEGLGLNTSIQAATLQKSRRSAKSSPNLQWKYEALTSAGTANRQESTNANGIAVTKEREAIESTRTHATINDTEMPF